MSMTEEIAPPDASISEEQEDLIAEFSFFDD